MENELKPCPFCGRTPYLNEIPPHTHMLPGLPDCEGECFVECNCTCCMSAKDREEAIKIWNTRVCDHASSSTINEKGNEEMKNTVTEQQVKNILNNSEIDVRTVYGKVTVVCCKLPNGFVITEASGAVDPANYSEEIGKQICMERIENKIWELEGYALSKKLYGE